ncbi:MAG: molybdopterin-dependent oxidoreductase [Kofleriaceae bacterium]|nr:molybdopterin-dependent oxidoreductase [Kofleriaceae bacterium]
MRRVSFWSGLFVGALTSVLALALLELGAAAWKFPFVPFDMFEWITRILPGLLITAGIDVMVSLISALGIRPTSVAAKLAEQGMAILVFVVGSAILGGLVALVSRGRTRIALVAGVVAGALLLTAGIEAASRRGEPSTAAIVWLAAVLLGWGALCGGLLATRASIARKTHGMPARAERGRRNFLLGSIAGVAGASAALFAIARRLRPEAIAARGPTGRAARLRDISGTTGPAASPRADVLARRIMPVQGTRPELTPNSSFYRIDINLEPPRVNAEEWRLGVEGLVDHPLSLSLDEIRRMPAVSQVITLECISNRVGGDLIGTSLWTGVRLRELLDRAGLQQNARAVHIRAADGFYESVELADMNDPRTLLVYEMNREPLADIHGFPLRIYIPNRHGMKQPKWITKLHVADRDGPGYWVERGWSAKAIPHTTSVIDVVDKPLDRGGTRVVPVGGIAYAGARGISRVEVQVDGGAWEPASLIAPPLSPLCWVLWRYEWPYKAGKHTFRVRAFDGTGAAQEVRVEPPHPDGATGIDELVAKV